MSWLTWADAVNLIDGLNYYLALGILVGVVIRVRTYRAVVGLVFASPKRWPKLVAVAKSHRTVFLGWPLLLTLGLAFAALVGNALASRLVFTHARVTFEDLRGHWLPFGVILLTGGLMLYLDGKAIFGGGRFDRAAVEHDLDKAESWLQSWVAPAIRLATFGIVNPRRIVGEEVHRQLVEANWAMIGGVWWSTLLLGVQFAFALSLWLTWVFVLRPPA